LRIIRFLSGLFAADVEYNPVVGIVDRSRARDSGWSRSEHPEEPLTRAEARTPRACSLQHRELTAQDNKFQQEIKALAEPRPHCRKPSKDPSRHEL